MVFTNLSFPSDLLGKIRELQDRPARNFMLRSFKTNEAAAVPERVNLGIHGFVCMCENSFTVILFVCFLYSSKRTGKRLSTEKNKQAPQAHSMCTATQQALRRPRLPRGLQLVLTMGTAESMSFLNATLLPQCSCAHLLLVKHGNDSILSTSQFFPRPTASLYRREYELHFGPEFSKLQICPSWPLSRHLSPFTDPSP